MAHGTEVGKGAEELEFDQHADDMMVDELDGYEDMVGDMKVHYDTDVSLALWDPLGTHTVLDCTIL